MGAIAVHHTATEDSAWDGPAAVAAMPNDDTVLKYCHAWMDSDAAGTPHKEDDDDADDQKGNYKFPHHRKKGGPANIPACHNGLSRLAGAHVPDGDRAGIKAHLQAHIDDAEKKGGDNVATTVVGEPATIGNLTTAERVKRHVPRAQRLSNRPDWFRITDATDGAPARLDVYDEIGFWGVNASDFLAQLNAISSEALDVHVNSPGGDVFDGIAILNMLRAHPAAVNVTVDGLAASAASFIAMAGDTVTMMPNSQLMIHDASGICMGNPADMTAMAELLDKVSDNIASVYAQRTGKPVDGWRAAMRTETWYTADEAVDAGLADRVGAVNRGTKRDDSDQPSDRWNLSFYNYDGRPAAPTPVPLVQPPAPAAPVYLFDPTEFRTAMKEAAQ